MRENMKLPAKPSALIRLALDDLEKCEQSPQYRVDMYLWHASHGTRCRVCLAGAVMAQHGGLHPGEDHLPGDFPAHTARKLCALDFFRQGDVGEGLLELGHEDVFRDFENISVPLYAEDPEGFKDALRDLAMTLEKGGL